MFNWVRNLFTSSPAKPATISDRENRELLARYDNAQTTQENARLWGLADPLSAKSANSYNVRRTLRNRSRYEYANNSFLQGSVNTKVNNMVGSGPTLKVTTPDEKFNQQVEAAVASWFAAVAMTEKVRTSAKAKIVDGEGFLFLTTHKDLNHSVKLYPLDVECDQVTSPMVGLSPADWVDGLVLDDVGRPAAYKLLQSHPGDFFFNNLNPLAFKTVAARWVIHWFRKDRPGQVRGIPETTSTLDLWGERRRFRKATVTAAETAASVAAVIKTEAPADPDDDELDAQGQADPFKSITLERGTATVLPWGADIGQITAKHPTTTFDSFSESLLGESSRGIGVPLNVVLGTSQKFNFSSARLDHTAYYADLRVERSDCERVVLDPILAAFLNEAVMVPGLLPDGIDIENLPHEWHWPAFPYLDPLTDAQTDTERLTKNRTMSYRRFYAQQGLDWQEELTQLAAEKKLMDKLGLSPVAPEPVAKKPGAPAEEGATASFIVAGSEDQPRDEKGRYESTGGGSGSQEAHDKADSFDRAAEKAERDGDHHVAKVNRQAATKMREVARIREQIEKADKAHEERQKQIIKEHTDKIKEIDDRKADLERQAQQSRDRLADLKKQLADSRKRSG